jgi:GT2 family glycosyltransferase
MTPTTAAVVLNWNGLEDTRRCLRSLLEPGGPERVVVVDNGSGGGEAEALLRDHAGDARVEVVALPRNRGFAGGVNEGVRRALAAGAGEVLLLNNDAVLEPGCFPALRAALAADPGAAAAGPRILMADGTRRAWFAGGRVRVALGQTFHPGHGIPSADLPQGEPEAQAFLTFCAVLVRREAWEAVGPLDEEFFAYFEDADWCVRAVRGGRRLLHCPRATALHRGGASTGGGSPLQAYLLARGRVLFARRHNPLPVRALVFWPWMLLLRLPLDCLRALAGARAGAARAYLRGAWDGVRGGAPRAFRERLGLGGPS